MELRGVQIFLPNHNLERTELKMALTMKAKSTYVFRLFKLRDAPGTVICDEHGNSMLFVRELFAIH